MHNNEYDKKHFNRSEKYVKEIEKLYVKLINQLSLMVAMHNISTDKPFEFANYPLLKSEVDKMLLNLAKNINIKIESAISKEWILGEQKALKELNLPEPQKGVNRPQEIQRKLSDRIWKYTNAFEKEIEMGLDLGVREGKSASEIARDLKQYLNEPDKLFRRVRDEHGNLHLSKKAEEYKPGRGVYRSSKKNAERLTRTETNIAYHTASYEKYQQLDFVLGIEIKLSNNPNHCPFCAEMVGKYPKEFKFVGWHPQCRCTTIPILSDDPFIVNKADRITEPPQAFKDWINNNREKIETAKTEPYFIRDNKEMIKGIWGEGEIKNNALKLMNKAKMSENEIKNVLKIIETKTGGYSTPINYKTEESIIRKAKLDHNGDVFEIKDSIRATVIVSEKKYKEMLHNMDKFYNFERIKIQTPDKFLGYSGILTNIKTSNNIYAEIQINTDKMIFAKERPQDAIRIIGQKRWNEIQKETGMQGGLGHKFYEQIRILDKNNPKRRELELKSIEYYSKFR